MFTDCTVEEYERQKKKEMMTKYTNRIALLLCTITLGATLCLPLNAQARLIQCWKNDIGIRECGASVPPEHSQKRIEIVNDRGFIVKVIPAAKTKEELARERIELRARLEQEAYEKERKRQDAILLNSYTTERDLILARDNNLKTIDGQIDVSKSNLRTMRENLATLQKRAANFERSGKKPPEKLLKEIEESKQSISKKEEHIENRETERKKMAQRFEEDLTRFRELKNR